MEKEKSTIAILDSRNYTYLAMGKTEVEAKEVIRERWNKFQKTLQQNGSINEPHIYSNIDAMEKDYDIMTVSLAPGDCIMW